MKELKELIEYYLMEVVEKGEDFLPTLCNVQVARGIILGEYKRLNLDISLSSEEDKRQIWEFVIEKYPNETRYFKTETSKIIFTITHLLCLNLTTKES